MKTIGLIGGMSWESSSLYYSLINQEIRSLLGQSHSAKILMYSFDFQEIEEMQFAGDWVGLKDRLYAVGRLLKVAGADGVVLCTNTMHKVMDTFEADVGIPLLHIVDALGEAIVQGGLRKVGLLGTRFTMEDGFYTKRLETRFGLEVLTPSPRGRDAVHNIIYDELVRGIVSDQSRGVYEEVIEGLVREGAEGVVLGCTEIGMLVKEARCPLFDSTTLHSRVAAKWLVD